MVKALVKKVFGKIRNLSLKSDKFTIISNNCWGGLVYQRYNLPYNTPTVGLYFFADDYIKFVSDLEYYLSLKLNFIDVEKSRHYEVLQRRGELDVPIGILDDVEIVFLHYKDKEEAFNKWERRKTRVDRSNLIIKFSEMNQCTDQHLARFNNLPYKIKFVFTHNIRPDIESSVVYYGYEMKTEVENDTNKYADYIQIDSLINDKVVIGGKTSFWH